MIRYFGKTSELAFIDDFNSELSYVIDMEWGNCSIYSKSPNDTDAEDYPASDEWIHGGIVSMKDPEWFWHIPDPKVYWYKAVF